MDELLTSLPSSAFHSLSETAGPDAAAAAAARDAVLFISSATGGSAGGIRSWLCSRYLTVVVAHVQTVSSTCMAEELEFEDTRMTNSWSIFFLHKCTWFIQVTWSNAV